MKNSREHILDVATQLLQSRGYAGFSYADITEQVGIRKASIHYHFPTKADLALAIVDRMKEQTRKAYEAADAQGWSYQRKIIGYIEAVRDILDLNDRICIGGSIQSDLNVLPEKVIDAFKTAQQIGFEWLTTTLREGRDAGEFKFAGEPEEVMITIVAALQGGLQNARLYGKKIFDQITEQINRMLHI